MGQEAEVIDGVDEDGDKLSKMEATVHQNTAQAEVIDGVDEDGDKLSKMEATVHQNTAQVENANVNDSSGLTPIMENPYTSDGHPTEQPAVHPSMLMNFSNQPLQPATQQIHQLAYGPQQQFHQQNLHQQPHLQPVEQILPQLQELDLQQINRTNAIQKQDLLQCDKELQQMETKYALNADLLQQHPPQSSPTSTTQHAVQPMGHPSMLLNYSQQTHQPLTQQHDLQQQIFQRPFQHAQQQQQELCQQQYSELVQPQPVQQSAITEEIPPKEYRKRFKQLPQPEHQIHNPPLIKLWLPRSAGHPTLSRDEDDQTEYYKPHTLQEYRNRKIIRHLDSQKCYDNFWSKTRREQMDSKSKNDPKFWKSFEQEAASEKTTIDQQQLLSRIEENQNINHEWKRPNECMTPRGKIIGRRITSDP